MLGLLGATLTVLLAVRSAQRLPPIEEPAWWAFVVLAAITSPLTLGLNAAELLTIARLGEVHLDRVAAFRISVVGSVANLLPIPGALLIRSSALYRAGMSLPDVAMTNGLAAGLWLALSGAAMGAALLCCHTVAGATITVAGVLVAATLAVRLARYQGWRLALQLLGIEAMTVGVTSLRVGLAFVAIDQSVDAASAVVIGASQPLSAAAGVFPGGLGLRELLSGLLARAVDVSSDAAILAAVVDRVTGLAGLGAVVLLVGVQTVTRTIAENREDATS